MVIVLWVSSKRGAAGSAGRTLEATRTWDPEGSSPQRNRRIRGSWRGRASTNACGRFPPEFASPGPGRWLHGPRLASGPQDPRSSWESLLHIDHQQHLLTWCPRGPSPRDSSPSPGSDSTPVVLEASTFSGLFPWELPPGLEDPPDTAERDGGGREPLLAFRLPGCGPPGSEPSHPSLQTYHGPCTGPQAAPTPSPGDHVLANTWPSGRPWACPSGNVARIFAKTQKTPAG